MLIDPGGLVCAAKPGRSFSPTVQISRYGLVGRGGRLLFKREFNEDIVAPYFANLVEGIAISLYGCRAILLGVNRLTCLPFLLLLREGIYLYRYRQGNTGAMVQEKEGSYLF